MFRLTNDLKRKIDSLVHSLGLPSRIHLGGMGRKYLMDQDYGGHGWSLRSKDVVNLQSSLDKDYTHIYSFDIRVDWKRDYQEREGGQIWLVLNPKPVDDIGLSLTTYQVGEHDLKQVSIQVTEAYELLPEYVEGYFYTQYGTLEEYEVQTRVVKRMVGA